MKFLTLILKSEIQRTGIVNSHNQIYECNVSVQVKDNPKLVSKRQGLFGHAVLLTIQLQLNAPEYAGSISCRSANIRTTPG